MKIDIEKLKRQVEFLKGRLEKEKDEDKRKWYQNVLEAYETIIRGDFEK